MRREGLSQSVRDRLVRLPHPHAGHYGVVPARPPETGPDLSSVLPRLVAATKAMATVSTIASEMADPYLVSRILTRREAVSSSSIEGTNSTLDELLATDDAEEGGNDETRQVRDYALVLDELVPAARRSGSAFFTKELLDALHERVMRSDPSYKGERGAYRREVVWIGGRGDIAYSTWTPPPPDRLAACMAESVDYLRNEGLQSVSQNLVTRMAVAHVHFEAVHPYRDGNGRVGRLLLPLMMAADGGIPLYLSPYIEANRSAYYEALKAAQQRLDWAAAIGFVSDAIAGTVDELLATRRALARLRLGWEGRRRFRKGSAAALALDVLPHHPVVGIRRLGELLDVTPTQARLAVDQLVGAGILSERTGYARNRIFSATEVLSVVNRPFGEDPVLGPEASVEAGYWRP
jgi:Fic family protein